MPATTVAAVAILALTILGTFSAWSLTNSYASQLYTQDISLPAKTLSESKKPVQVSVDFHRSFSSIDSVCFVFQFKNNLLDQGDELYVSNFGGFFNPNTSPQASRTICSVSQYHQEIIERYLDGQEDFDLQMITGSVKISSLEIQITGTSLT